MSQVASPQLRKLVEQLLRLSQPALAPQPAEKQDTAAASAQGDAQGRNGQPQQQDGQAEEEEEAGVPTDPAAAALLIMQLAAEARQLLQPHIAPTKSNCGDRYAATKGWMHVKTDDSP